MNILIIGGAGYMGSHLAEILVPEHKVVIFDDLKNGYAENIPKNASFVKGDILNIPELDSVFEKKFDIVMHFAALKNAGESMSKPAEYYDINVVGTFNILNCMVKHGVKRIVFSSSAAVYGNPKYIPIDELHPLHPENVYGFTKLECEKLLEWYSKIYGINYISLRYFNTAGYMPGKCMEKNPGNLLPIMMEVASGRRDKLKIYGNNHSTPDGTPIRDYVHVLDLADAQAKAMNYVLKNSSNLTLNLSSGKGYSVMQVLFECERVTGKKINYEIIENRPGEPSISIASADLARDILGWTPQHSELGNILSSMWEIYKK